MRKRVVSDHPPDTKMCWHPYFLIAIGIPVLIFTALAAWYVVQYITWVQQGHLSALLFLLIPGSASLVPLLWKAYTSVDSYFEAKQDRIARREQHRVTIRALDRATQGYVQVKMAPERLEISSPRSSEIGRHVSMQPAPVIFADDVPSPFLARTSYDSVPMQDGSATSISGGAAPSSCLVPEDHERSVAFPSGPTLFSAQRQLPPPFTDLDVYRHWDLSPTSIYLARGKGGRDLSCSLEGLCHVAHDASTGKGKTLLLRSEVAMLLKIGADVLLCNPHFAPVDKKGHDWRPIAAFLDRQGPLTLTPDLYGPRLIRKLEDIRDILKWLALTELDRRFELQAQGQFSWRALYLVLDELPYLISLYPECATYIIGIAQRGRAVDVFLNLSAQSFLVSNTGLKGGARENFDTAYFLGGSTQSGAVLLDMSRKDLEALLRTEHVELGQGIGMLRNNERVPNAELVRIARGTNEGLYYLLGKADSYVLPEFRSRSAPETNWQAEGVASAQAENHDAVVSSRPMTDRQTQQFHLLASPCSPEIPAMQAKRNELDGRLVELAREAWQKGYTGGRPLQRALTHVFQHNPTLARTLLGRTFNPDEQQTFPLYTANKLAELLRNEDARTDQDCTLSDGTADSTDAPSGSPRLFERNA